MTINNLEYSPPSQVRQLLYSLVPFGSEWVCYCSHYSQSGRTYDIIFKKPISDQLYHYQAISSGSGYSLAQVSTIDTFDGFVVSYPYYCYSSVPEQGIRESLPTTNDFICLMLIVCASLAVLKTVFGGVRLWVNRRKYRV